ncbi:MAG: sigma-54 dependent transcriptional regulator [Pseudomonadota bacterium]
MTIPHSPILVIDDDTGLLRSVKTTLVRAGLPEPETLDDSRRVIPRMAEHPFRLAIIDLIMPHIDGIALLQEIKAKYPATECIIVTAIDDTDTAVTAMKYGAYDYLVKPIDREKLTITVNRALERYSLKQELSLVTERRSFEGLTRPDAFAHLVAADPAMARVFHQVEAVAPTDYSVLVTGESGTGKEEIARLIHRLSNRASQPFVAVNVAAISGPIFEGEFFGHEKGAFTGATAARAGFFERADAGTLFLDEIAELDPGLQAKLLRVIQERELYRLGSTAPRRVNVRLICATNQELSRRIETGQFRADLYHRIRAYGILLPPLRERREDILPLANHLLKQRCQETGKDIRAIAPEMAAYLLAHPLPGNIRELDHIIAGAVLLESGTTLSLAAMDAADPSVSTAVPAAIERLEAVERRHIQAVLAHTGGNRTQAARILGIGLRTLQRKIKT